MASFFCVCFFQLLLIFPVVRCSQRFQQRPVFYCSRFRFVSFVSGCACFRICCSVFFVFYIDGMARGAKLIGKKLNEARDLLSRKWKITAIARKLEVSRKVIYNLKELKWAYGEQKLGRKLKVRRRRRDRSHRDRRCHRIHVEPPHVVLQHLLPPTMENLRENDPGIPYKRTPRSAPPPQIRPCRLCTVVLEDCFPRRVKDPLASGRGLGKKRWNPPEEVDPLSSVGPCWDEDVEILSSDEEGSMDDEPEVYFLV